MKHLLIGLYKAEEACIATQILSKLYILLQCIGQIRWKVAVTVA